MIGRKLVEHLAKDAGADLVLYTMSSPESRHKTCGRFDLSLPGEAGKLAAARQGFFVFHRRRRAPMEGLTRCNGASRLDRTRALWCDQRKAAGGGSTEFRSGLLLRAWYSPSSIAIFARP
jgi:hypothetical protein